MKITKYPKSDTNAFGYIELKPGSYNPANQHPLVVHLHGNGGNGSGSDADLQKLIDGELPEEIQKAVDVYQFIAIATQVNGEYSDGEVDHAIGYAVRNLPINTKKRYLCGTSFGGRLGRWLSKSPDSGRKFAGCVVSCGVNYISNAKNIADSGLPIIFFHAQDDGTVNVNSTHQAVSSINQYPMPVPAKKVIYSGGQHWIWNKVFHSTESPWTGNESPKTVWEYLLMLEAGKPIPVPMKAPDNTMVIDAGPDQNVTVDRIKLNGSNSRGYASVSWQIQSNPPGVNVWNIFYNGAGWHTVDAFLEVPGVYIFKLVGKDSAGAKMEDTVQVVYTRSATEPPPTFTPTHLIKHKDGSSEEVRIETL